MSAWLIGTVLLPPALVGVARLLRPVPPFLIMAAERLSAFNGEVRAGEDALGDALVAFRHAEPAALKRDVDPRFIAAGMVDKIWLPHAQRARQRAQAINDAWGARRREQEQLLMVLESLSPASLFWRAATNVSGTGRQARDTWQQAINTHEQLLRQAVFDDRARVNLRTVAERSREVLFVDRHRSKRLSELPQFDSAQISVERTTSSGFLIGLLGYAAFAGGLAFYRFNRSLS